MYFGNPWSRHSARLWKCVIPLSARQFDASPSRSFSAYPSLPFPWLLTSSLITEFDKFRRASSLTPSIYLCHSLSLPLSLSYSLTLCFPPVVLIILLCVSSYEGTVGLRVYNNLLWLVVTSTKMINVISVVYWCRTDDLCVQPTALTYGAIKR